MNIKDELRHLKEGPQQDEKPCGIGTVRFIASSMVSAKSGLDNAREVMISCLRLSPRDFDDIEFLRSTLPHFFVANLRAESVPGEDEDYLETWRSANDEQRSSIDQNRNWSLSEWASWMRPDDRKWWWWDALVISPRHCAIAIVVEDWPFPWGSLKILLRNCGFDEVQPEAKKMG